MNSRILSIEIDQNATKDRPVIFVCRTDRVRCYYRNNVECYKLHRRLLRLGLKLSIWINNDGSIDISHIASNMFTD